MKIDRSLYLKMLCHAVVERPVECVGVLAGPPDGPPLQLYRGRNVSQDPTKAYQLDPAEQIRIEEEIEAAGLVPLAIYHSHPTSEAIPSGLDKMTAWNPLVSIIFGLVEFPEFIQCRAWKLYGTNIPSEEPLEVV